MARKLRVDVGGYYYHVLNRAQEGKELFTNTSTYLKFIEILNEASLSFEIEIAAYALMPNHWHLMIYSKKDKELSRAMQWISTSHTTWHRTKSNSVGTGHVYQGRYKSFIIKDDYHALTVLKYIERNPVRAGLGNAAEDWKWGSAHARAISGSAFLIPHNKLHFTVPLNYSTWLNSPEPSEQLAEIRKAVQQGFY